MGVRRWLMDTICEIVACIASHKIHTAKWSIETNVLEDDCEEHKSSVTKWRVNGWMHPLGRTWVAPRHQSPFCPFLWDTVLTSMHPLRISITIAREILSMKGDNEVTSCFSYSHYPMRSWLSALPTDTHQDFKHLVHVNAPWLDGSVHDWWWCVHGCFWVRLGWCCEALYLLLHGDRGIREKTVFHGFCIARYDLSKQLRLDLNQVCKGL